MQRKRRPLPEELKIIQKITHVYARRHPWLEFEELFSEACLAYIESMNNYDPSKGAVNTFIWRVVHSRMVDLIGKEVERVSKIFLPGADELEKYIDPNELTSEQHTIAQEQLEELVQTLSPEAQEIYRMVVEENKVYLPVDKGRECRGIISRALRQDGWSWERIWGAFREVKQTLSLTA